MGKLQQKFASASRSPVRSKGPCSNLFRTSDRMQHRFARLFREYGLTPSQYNILRILRSEGKAMPCLEIAQRTITVVPGITGLIDRLEQSGLVTRQHSEEDRRVVNVSITTGRRGGSGPAGRAAAGAAPEDAGALLGRGDGRADPPAGEGPPRLRGGVGLTGTPFALRAKGNCAELVRLQAERSTRKAKR